MTNDDACRDAESTPLASVDSDGARSPHRRSALGLCAAKDVSRITVRPSAPPPALHGSLELEGDPFPDEARTRRYSSPPEGEAKADDADDTLHAKDERPSFWRTIGVSHAGPGPR